ncbi:hypothetical protein [Singulisphaera acidiphila]|uniref:Carboxypeptidase regulatory-like domain-containing protein n=1 Tax=Singulisphaera acidiphila (strain ATCC BAA-1392 / DSM 18658 / VKM B-2454 / MOB10) TaxID=886293 RepID=L0D823_SINAD|nr:hypothetical protein [Singulisphaera acidiphila]AGA24801.1 hypothetical protein Sinac_0361 [Singulisphaera acidiphila DSM 18658]
MRTFRQIRSLSGMIVMTSFLIAGCDNGVEDLRAREPISGTVTFEGQPLKEGTIQLQPATQQEGVASGGMVSDGRFEIPRAEGPVPGTYTVAIYAAAGTATSGSAEESSPTAPMPRARKTIASLRGVIPTRYNIETELKAEVKSGGPNTYAFHLKK